MLPVAGQMFLGDADDAEVSILAREAHAWAVLELAAGADAAVHASVDVQRQAERVLTLTQRCELELSCHHSTTNHNSISFTSIDSIILEKNHFILFSSPLTRTMH